MSMLLKRLFMHIATYQKGAVVNLSFYTFLRFAVVLLVIANCMYCSNPADDPPLRWRQHFVVPLTNEQYKIGNEFDKLFDIENLEVRKDDTLSFAVTREDTVHYERIEPGFDTTEYRVGVDSLKIRNMADISKDIPYDAVGNNTTEVKVPLPGVREIVFATTDDNTLVVTVTNNTDAELDTIKMSVLGAVDSAHTINVDSSAELNIDMSDKTIGDTLTIELSTYSENQATGSVSCVFSLNGLSVFSMEVLDSIIAYSHEYSNLYKLTDTMDIDYIDIDRGSFIYSIVNHCGVSFDLQCEHDHLWNTTFCKSNGIDSIEDFSTLSSVDSIHFKGGSSGTTIEAGPNSTSQLREIVLSGGRLFPEWNDSLDYCVTKIRYFAQIHATGEYVSISVLDSMMFTVTTYDFAFETVAGTFVRPITYEADTQRVGIELPWKNTVKDSLRGRFILDSVTADLQLQFELGLQTLVDTLNVTIYAFDPESTEIVNSLPTQFINLRNDTVYNRTMNITNVTNQFSDSIAVAMQMSIPSGTFVQFSTDTRVALPSGAIGRMVVDAYTDFQLNARLDWEVNELVNMDIGSSRVPLPDALQYFRRMSGRNAQTDIWVSNNSNLQVSLYALAAPDTLMNELDSLSMNEMYTYLLDSDSAADDGYINLLGITGIIVPQRDTTYLEHSSVALDDREIGLLLETDSLNLRWWVQFKEQDRDVLRETDFIEVTSQIDIRGTNNTDSLIIW